MNRKISNQLLFNGKKTLSEKIWLKIVKSFNKSLEKDHTKLINRALINIAFLLKIKELKQKKRKAQSKEFPYIVTNKNRISSALKFFLDRKKNKNEVKIYRKFVTDLLAAANKSVISTNKRKYVYEYAYLKKKYFYYRWF